MFEKDETTGQIIFSHNPFSMPQGGLDALEAWTRWRSRRGSMILSVLLSCPQGNQKPPAGSHVQGV